MESIQSNRVQFRTFSKEIETIYGLCVLSFLIVSNMRKTVISLRKLHIELQIVTLMR